MARDYYDNYGFNEATPSTALQYIGRETAEEKDVLGAAFSEAMAPMAAYRMWDRRSSQFEADEQWRVDDKMREDLVAQYSKKDEEYLSESKSEQEFLARKTYIKEDLERQAAIASGGSAGIIATMGLSLLDPVSLGIGWATGGIGYGAKATGIARAAKVALASGIENAVVEAVLMGGNTQSKATDLLLAFGGGATIGAALSPLSRSKNPAMAAGADEFDRATSLDVDGHIVGEVTTAARGKSVPPIEAVHPGADVRKMQADMSAYETRLTRETQGRVSRGGAQQIRKRIKELEVKADIENQHIKDVQAELQIKRDTMFENQKKFVEEAGPARIEIETKYADRIKKQEERIAIVERNLEKARVKQKQAAKLWKEEMKLDAIKKEAADELKSVEAKLKKKVAASEWRFQKAFARRTKAAKARRSLLDAETLNYRDQLAKGAKAKQSANDLRKWRAMNENTRIQHLFGDEVPSRRAEVERQIAGSQPVTEDVVEVTTRVEGVGFAEAAPQVSTVQALGAVEPGAAGAFKVGDRILNRVYTLDQKAQMDLARFAYDGGKVPEDLRGVQLPGFTKAIQGIQTRLSNSADMAIRGLTYHLFEAPQGGSAAKFTAAARVKNYTTQIRSAMRNRLDEGLDEWADGQGISKLNARLKPENFMAYHKMVMQEVKRPGTYNAPPIIRGAEGVREQLKTAGEIRQGAGEAGFENIDLDRNYVPIIMNETLVKSALVQHGEAKVVDTISLGYQQGRFKLNKKLADRVADGYVQRAKDHTLSMRDYVRTATDTDAERLARDLEAAGVEKDIIDDFLDSTTNRELREHMSNRAKKSLEPDLGAELNGLKMIDLVDTELPKLLEAYTKDSAGGAAMAKLGFTTKSQVMDFLTNVEKAATNNGLNPAQIAKEIQILRDGIDMLYGRSINPDAHSPLVRNIGRLRDLTGFLRLQAVGISSIPEIARVTTQRSIRGVLEHCPDLGIGLSGTKHLREGGKYSGHFKRSDLDELEAIMGYVGEDHVLYPNGLRVDNIEESGMYGSLGSMVDNMLERGKRVQEVLSAFRLVQGGGEKLAARSLGGQIKKWVDGVGDALSDSNIRDAGWHDGFLDEVKEWMTANPATDIHNKKEIRLFNFGQMPAEMQERLQVGMHRLVSRDMQRPLVGETPTFMHKWLGQTMTQFRSFSLLSLEKQLIHDVRGDRMAGAIIALQSAFMSYAALTISALNSEVGKSDADERIKKRLTGMNAVIGTFNKMGQVASVGIGFDLLATLGALPDDMMAAPGQTGYRGLSSSSVPVVGLAGDVLDVAKDIPGMLKGEVEGNRTLKDIQTITPFMKTIGINQAMNYILE